MYAIRSYYASANLTEVKAFLDAHAETIEKDNTASIINDTLNWIPVELQGQWKRQWMNAFEKGTRQLVPSRNNFV